MSEAKSFKNFIAELPYASTSSNSVLTANYAGDMQRIAASSYAQIRSVSVPIGSVLKISGDGGLMSTIVSARGCQGNNACFAWVSSYNEGLLIRTNAAIMYSPSWFKWFVNGASESLAAVYVKIEGGPATGIEFFVTSLTGHIPTLEVVSAVPTDATPLKNDLTLGGGNLLPYIAERRCAA